jgi:hypothetical protein
MPTKEFFTTIKYRTNGSVLSLDFLLHRSKKAMAKFLGNSIEIADTSTTKPIVTIPLRDITMVTTGHGVMRISAAGKQHALDFSSPFYQGLFAGSEAKKRAQELQLRLESAGISVVKKFF